MVGASGDDPSGTGAVLDDKEAYDLFNRYCEPDLARGFKLYKLYERAAAFGGQPPQVTGPTFRRGVAILSGVPRALGPGVFFCP